MTNPTSRTGVETTIRAIVFKEGDLYVAQCLEYDICVQSANIPTLLDRLHLTVEAEFATCKAAGKRPHERICQAPNYYHSLWNKRSVQLSRISIPAPEGGEAEEVGCDLDIALTESTRAAA